MKVLSLGWGVQSFTLAAMVALGELPMVDAVIHSDTTHESILTYRFAEKWTPWLEDRGVKVVTVKNKKNEIITDRPGGEIFIPAFTLKPERISDGWYYDENEDGEIQEYFDSARVGQLLKSSNGQLRRQCTQRWKIAPLRRWLQSNRKGERVDMWIGISTDEFKRMRDSDVKYITNIYPLVENNMSRKDCKKWLSDHNLEEPPKSACTFCPYHSRAGWMQINQTPEDMQSVIEVDERIRKVRPPYDLFVHPSRKPLADIDFRTPEEQGQMSLWDNECSGICGV